MSPEEVKTLVVQLTSRIKVARTICHLPGVLAETQKQVDARAKFQEDFVKSQESGAIEFTGSPVNPTPKGGEKDASI